MAETEVWWAAPADARPELAKLLNPVEQGRRERYLRDEDRDRFTLGVAVTRLVVGERLGLSPEKVLIDRTCADCDKPHGPPTVKGGPYITISHSGERIGIGFSDEGPLGVDVELLQRRPGPAIDKHVLSAAEAERHSERLPIQELLTYWTRKEAVLKATGDGLRVPMPSLTVSPPDQPPRLLAWPDRPDVPQRMTMHTLTPGGEHLASLALLDQPGATVRERPASELLR